MVSHTKTGVEQMIDQGSSSIVNIASSSGTVGRDNGLEVACVIQGRRSGAAELEIVIDEGDGPLPPLMVENPPMPDVRGGEAIPTEPGLVPVAGGDRSQLACCCWNPSWGLPPDIGGGLTGLVAGIR